MYDLFCLFIYLFLSSLFYCLYFGDCSALKYTVNITIKIWSYVHCFYFSSVVNSQRFASTVCSLRPRSLICAYTARVCAVILHIRSVYVCVRVWWESFSAVKIYFIRMYLFNLILNALSQFNYLVQLRALISATMGNLQVLSSFTFYSNNRNRSLRPATLRIKLRIFITFYHHWSVHKHKKVQKITFFTLFLVFYVQGTKSSTEVNRSPRTGKYISHTRMRIVREIGNALAVRPLSFENNDDTDNKFFRSMFPFCASCTY